MALWLSKVPLRATKTASICLGIDSICPWSCTGGINSITPEDISSAGVAHDVVGECCLTIQPEIFHRCSIGL